MESSINSICFVLHSWFYFIFRWPNRPRGADPREPLSCRRSPPSQKALVIFREKSLSFRIRLFGWRRTRTLDENHPLKVEWESALINPSMKRHAFRLWSMDKSTFHCSSTGLGNGASLLAPTRLRAASSSAASSSLHLTAATDLWNANLTKPAPAMCCT